MKLNKLVFITSHPIQYQVPIFKKIAKFNKNFSVIFENKVKKNVIINDQGFNKKIKWGNSLVKGYKFSHFRKKTDLIINIKNLYMYLKKNNIEYVILSGWNSSFYKLAFIISKILKIKIVLRCENNFYEDSFFKKNLKRIIFRFFFNLIHKFIAISKKNEEMYLECNVSKNKIINANYFVDNNFFSKKFINFKKRKIMRKKYKSNGQKIFLFVGKLISRKGLDVLFNSIRLLKEKNLKKKILFLIVGSGTEERKYKQMKINYNLSNILFTNFKNQKELLYFYDLADFLILPSYYETWGLVANESLEMGTPCIVSNGCGCANDMVKDNINGFSFNKGNHIELANLIAKISKNDKRNRITSKSIKHSLKKYNIDKTVNAILKLS